MGNNQIDRTVKLIKREIENTDLDLTGLTVFTEAASGVFSVTPLIAACANASKVFCIGRDSSYGAFSAVKKDIMELATHMGVADRVDVLETKDDIDKADIITNLGFVRPIDESDINRLKSTAVIPYMCETWEVRPGDVDIAMAFSKGIPVMGTNERVEGNSVFDYCGPLAHKMLFEAGIEVHGCRIAIVSSDLFGVTISNYLKGVASEIFHVDTVECCFDKGRFDAIVIADYSSGKRYFYDTERELDRYLELLKGCTVLQFAGDVNTRFMEARGIICYPENHVGSHRMGKTLGHLGNAPVIRLHALGLKVGELMARKRMEGNNAEQVVELLRYTQPCQALLDEE